MAIRSRRQLSLPAGPAYPGDLNVVQLLLPVQDRLHPVHPHVDVPDQHALADPLHQRAQGRVEGLEQFPD